MWVQALGGENPLEECMATCSSILAWRIPWTEEPGGLQSIGSQRVGNDWSGWACTHACIDIRQRGKLHFFLFCFHTLIFLLLYPLFHWDIFLLQRKHDSQSPKLYAVALSLQFHSTVIHWETSDHFLTGCSLACPPVLFLVEILSSKDLWIFPSKHLSANSSFICRKLMLFLLRNALKHWP